MKNSIAFAYFADERFIGWYADSFGSVRRTPKLYSDLERMKPIITKNLTYKLKKINETSFTEAKEKTENALQAIGLATFDSEEALRGKNIELRAVACPEYNGPNPDFDEEAHKQLREIRREKLKTFLSENGIEYEDGPSKKRTALVEKFNETDPMPVANNWIYADYSKVKEWALTEPTEFLAVIKPE